MQYFRIGDLVARKSYGGDIYFYITNIIYRRRREPTYILKGVIHRLIADSAGRDLVRLDSEKVKESKARFMSRVKRHSARSPYQDILFSLLKRSKPGTILHLDGDEDFMERCLEHYKEAGINCIGRAIAENRQPYHVRELLEKHRPDILVLTGHDSMKKGRVEDSLDNYSNSRYFVESVKEARRYVEDSDRLCVFAGACQSHYEEIMSAGANLASSPGRILINALDPAMVAEKISVTDSRRVVTPYEVARLTESGSKGVWGINTRGKMIWI